MLAAGTAMSALAQTSAMTGEPGRALTAVPQLPLGATALVPAAPASSPLPTGAVGAASAPDPLQGVRVPVTGYQLHGNREFASDVLLALLPPPGPQVDLGELSATLTHYYHEHGFTFAQAVVPPQALTDGVVRIEVLEGRLGRITVTDTSRQRPGWAQALLAEQVCGHEHGAPECDHPALSEAGLQRATLTLSDVPGLKATSQLQPGVDPGTADLVVQVEPTDRVRTTIGADNFGGPATGRYRGSVSTDVVQLLGIGDRLTVGAIGSGHPQWDASVDYSALAGASAVRLGANAAHTSYTLGQSFAVLDASGQADVFTLYASSPLQRSSSSTVNAGAAFELKHTRDDIGLASLSSRRTIRGLVLSLSGSHTDEILGGGVTQYSLAATVGHVGGLDAHSAADDADAASGLHTAGEFTKITYSLERQQSLAGGLTLYGAINGQLANKNLSPSERFALGGPAGVHAYATGDGSGDSGWIGTAELRYSVALSWPATVLTTGAFVDTGRVRYDTVPVSAASNGEVLRAAGLRAAITSAHGFSLSLAYAQSLHTSDWTLPKGRQSQVWASTATQF